MKNNEMKVSHFLREKKELEFEINMTKRAIECLNGSFNHKDNNDESGTVGIYSHNSKSEFRFTATKGVMLKAANEMLELQFKALEPLIKKLEAIELMLNS